MSESLPRVEGVEQSGKSTPVPLLSDTAEGLNPDWKSGTGKLERCTGTVTTVEASSPNRSPLDLRAELEGFLDRFLLGKRGEGLSAATLSNYRRSLRLFFRYLLEFEKEARSLDGIAAEHLLRYRDHLLTRERQGGAGLLAATTVVCHLGPVKRFFEFFAESSDLLLDPSRAIKLPRQPRRLPRHIPTVQEMRRLLCCARRRLSLVGLRDAAILELFYGTGLRNAELCGLLFSDYDSLEGTLFVRKGKGGKDRVVPVGSKAREVLERYLCARPEAPDRDGPLFLTRRGKRPTTSTVRQLVRRVLSRARLSQKRFSPHSLRHACATHLLKGRADIRHIQALLGHNSLRTTEVYTRVDMTDLKRVLKRCHPREREIGQGAGEQG